jgi:hypothetical protein
MILNLRAVQTFKINTRENLVQIMIYHPLEQVRIHQRL